MTWIPPLLVADPLLAAALIAGGDHVLPDIVQDAVGALAAAAVCGLGIVLMLAAESHEVVHWFGGWRPHSGVAIGIDFAVGPLAAGLTALTGGVTLVSLVYGRLYLREAARLFDMLMLVACGAVCGFAMSGDLFDMFVWLELMGVAGYALTGFEVREMGPLQGAVNFSIVNTIGGFFVLFGIGLLYARTGALNLAQIGRTLAGQKADGLLVVALTLVVVGFLCKAAAVPFHLWLADAYAVAPAPVCALFAAVMTDVGLFGVARVYWTVFDAPFGTHEQAAGHLLLWVGIVTALLGAAMAFLQRNLKRMLAYAVICHVGVMLAGIGLLASKGLGGAAVMLLAAGPLTAGMFLLAGVLLAVLESVDELDLHGRGRRLPFVGALWALAALALAGAPYVGVYLGHALIDEAASDGGRHWVQPLIWLAEAVSSGALLRAGARVFLGWGDRDDPLLSREGRERAPERGRRTTVLALLAALMVVLGAAVSVVPGLAQRSVAAADRFRDRAGYANLVLHGIPMRHVPQLPFTIEHTTLESVLYGAGSTVLAVAVALLGLYRQRLPRVRLLSAPVEGLKAVHSGVVGDYVMWLTVGAAVIGGVWAVTLR